MAICLLVEVREPSSRWFTENDPQNMFLEGPEQFEDTRHDLNVTHKTSCRDSSRNNVLHDIWKHSTKTGLSSLFLFSSRVMNLISFVTL